jgi:hypothetical protein
MCSLCLPGYYFVSSLHPCTPCAPWSAAVSILVLVMSVVTVAFVLVVLPPGKGSTVSIVFFWLQLYAYKTESVGVPLSSGSAVRFLASMAVASPYALSCINSVTPLELSLYGPVIVMLALVPFYMVLRLTRKVFAHCFRLARSVDTWHRSLSQAYFRIALLLFLPITKVALETFHCVDVGSRRIMPSAPWVDCKSSWYTWFLVQAIAAFCLLSVSVPLLTLYAGYMNLAYGLSSSSFHKAEIRITLCCCRGVSLTVPFGFLFKNFRAKQWWWAVWVPVRSFFMALLAAFLDRGSSTMAYAMLLVLQLSLTLTLVARPYSRGTDNFIEVCALFQLIISFTVAISKSASSDSLRQVGSVTAVIFLAFVASYYAFDVLRGYCRKAPVDSYGLDALYPYAKKRKENREEGGESESESGNSPFTHNSSTVKLSYKPPNLDYHRLAADQEEAVSASAATVSSAAAFSSQRPDKPRTSGSPASALAYSQNKTGLLPSLMNLLDDP